MTILGIPSDTTLNKSSLTLEEKRTATLKERSGTHPFSFFPPILLFSWGYPWTHVHSWKDTSLCIPLTRWARFFALASWALKVHLKAQMTRIIKGNSLISPTSSVVMHSLTRRHYHFPMYYFSIPAFLLQISNSTHHVADIIPTSSGPALRAVEKPLALPCQDLVFQKQKAAPHRRPATLSHVL